VLENLRYLYSIERGGLIATCDFFVLSNSSVSLYKHVSSKLDPVTGYGLIPGFSSLMDTDVQFTRRFLFFIYF